MDSNNNALLNGVSIFFLGATVVAILVTGVTMFTGGRVEPESIPTEFLFPTETATPIRPTPFPTAIPSETSTPTETYTPSLTPTPRPSATGTATATQTPTITATPTLTATSDATETPTVEPSPTGPSATPPPALPFAGPAEPQFTQNFANTQGCAWQGIGGQVLALGGGAYTNPLQVHIYGAGQDFGRVFTGTNSNYGASGYEIRVANAITRDTYVIQLETRNGVPISEPIQIVFPGDCQQNVAIVDFQQVRSLNP